MGIVKPRRIRREFGRNEDAVFQAVKELALSRVRTGPRAVLWTPPRVNLGNHLYYWLHAFYCQQSGQDVRALATAEMSLWRQAFPRVFDRLVVAREKVGIRDRRLMPGAKQTFGVDFDAVTLDTFIEEFMASGGGDFSNLITTLPPVSGVTVNVRRGDYYSDPRWRGEYSFDVVEYVRTAMVQVLAAGAVDRITLVSDDPEWCRVKLQWLAEYAPITYEAASANPLGHLATLARSDRLILANSSFSYWGGYLSTHLAERTRSTTSGVWAPAFNNRRLPNRGRATQLHPRWNVIEEIPGGWDG